MMGYWVNFATRGDPNGAGLPAWPAYAHGRPSMLRLGDTVVVRPPLPAERLELLAR